MSEDEDRGEDRDTGLLPTPERIETMTNSELRELRDLLAVDWEGPEVEAFRQRVAERLAEDPEAETDPETGMFEGGDE